MLSVFLKLVCTLLFHWGRLDMTSYDIEARFIRSYTSTTAPSKSLHSPVVLSSNEAAEYKTTSRNASIKRVLGKYMSRFESLGRSGNTDTHISARNIFESVTSRVNIYSHKQLRDIIGDISKINSDSFVISTSSSSSVVSSMCDTTTFLVSKVNQVCLIFVLV